MGKRLGNDYAMNEQAMEELVRELVSYAEEEEWFEFKDSWYEPVELGEYISSLSNVATMQGKSAGYLVWGVDDETHALIGTKFKYQVNVKNEPLQHFLARQITPDINFSFHELEIDQKKIVILVVPAAKNEPTAFRGIHYFRIGSSKVNLDKFPTRLGILYNILSNGFPTIENTEAFSSKLTFNSLFDIYRKASLPLNENTFEHNLELKTKKGEFNLLAQLLADDSMMSIRIIQFSGDRKTSPLYAVRNFGNDCIINSFNKIMMYGDVLNVMQSDERERFAERPEFPLFDGAAFREAVVNALVHNDWLNGNGPAIFVFNNRIEIVSNGSIPPGQTLNGFFDGKSVPRNRKLAEIFLQLHISERSGRGILTITEKYGRDAIEITDNSIVVTIPFNRIDVTASASTLQNIITETGMKDTPPDSRHGDSLNKTRKRIILEIEKNPRITLVELSEKLHISDTAVENNISYLKKNGYISRRGGTRNGEWVVYR